MFADAIKINRIIAKEVYRDEVHRDIYGIYTLQEWSDKWMLKFHPDKCVAMMLNHRGEDYQYKFTDRIDSPLLKMTDVEKDIGIYVDNKLEFDVHISEKINKANNIFNLIRRSFQYLNEENSPPLFKSTVRTHVEQLAMLFGRPIKRSILKHWKMFRGRQLTCYHR